MKSIIMLTFIMTFFFYTNHPLLMGLTIMFITVMLSLKLGMMLMNFWYLYMLILIFIGGMLVLFMYVITLFPNEKLVFKLKPLMVIMTMNIILMATLIFFNPTYFYMKNIDSINLNMLEMNNVLKMSIKMFYSQTNMIIIMLVLYLLLSFIIITHITNYFQGPLRKMNYV